MYTNQQELSHFAPGQVRPLAMDASEVSHYEKLRNIGICLDSAEVMKMAEHLGKAFGMDADPVVPLTTPSISTPVQFLQSWLPGLVHIITAARKIDDLVGITTQGRWEDEEIVQTVLEHTGESVPYGDQTQIPLSSWNVNHERRSIVRFEEGLRVGKLEEARAAAMNVGSAQEKRAAAAAALEIIRNKVGFFGYNNGSNKTYGFLNDPELPAYVSVPVGAGGFTEWSTKTFLEIQADILTWLTALRVQSQDQIDPGSTPITMALATAARDQMSKTSDFGISVTAWLNEAYPNVTVVSAPELDGANGGENVAYVYATSVTDGSTDDGRTFVQVVPAKLQTLGVENGAKGYTEDYSNATAGVMLKRPYAVYRASDI